MSLTEPRLPGGELHGLGYEIFAVHHWRMDADKEK